MWIRGSRTALVVAALLASACEGRSPLSADLGGSGGAASSVSTTSTGGSAPNACPSLAVTAPADVDTGGGIAARPALVFGTNNGQVVSVFHALTQDPGAGTALQVTTLMPWESWPPSPGDRFVVDAHGGKTFAVGDQLHGNVALLFTPDDSDPEATNGLAYAHAVSATSPQTLLPMTLATIAEKPAAIELVRGYDQPPVALNLGYVAMLAMWDAVDETSGTHALKLAVGDGNNVFLGLVLQPDDPDLACAGDSIAAAAVRAGSSWLVLTATTTQDLLPCAEIDPPGPPVSLAVDRIAWDAPDTVEWTLSRTDIVPGSDPIERIRMIPTLDGGLALVQRHGGADLVRVDAKGFIHAAGSLSPASGSRILFSEIVPLPKGALLAHVDEGAPGQVVLEARDLDGAVLASSTIEAAGPIESLTSLGAKDGNSALIGWATNDGRVQLARAGCAEGE
jgi:hypothetical protein